MRGLFWELIGQVSTFGRQPGYGTPAGPSLDTMLYSYICEMVEDCAPVLCRAEGTITLSAGTGAGPYDLPSDFIDFLDVEDPLTLAGIELRQTRRTTARQMAAGYSSVSGVPTHWYEMGRKTTSSFGRQVGFWPPPTAAGTVYVPYLREPLTFSAVGSSTQYPDLPRSFHRAPVFGAAGEFSQHRPELFEGKDTNSWTAYYQNEKARLKRHTEERLRATMRNTVPDYTSAAFEDAMEV